MEVGGRVDGWEALGKAVSAEAEPRSVAERSGAKCFQHKLLNLTPLVSVLSEKSFYRLQT